MVYVKTDIQEGEQQFFCTFLQLCSFTEIYSKEMNCAK